MSEPQPTDSKFVIDVRKFVETAMNDGLRIQAIMLSQKNYEQLIELGLKLRPDLASEPTSSLSLYIDCKDGHTVEILKGSP